MNIYIYIYIYINILCTQYFILLDTTSDAQLANVKSVCLIFPALPAIDNQ